MEKILKKVYLSKKINLALQIISHVSSGLCVIAYLAMAVYAYIKAPVFCLKLLLSAGVPFVTVSLLRKIINAPRPYEFYDFYEEKPKGKAGESFPSRHVFSAFVIATLAYAVSLPLSLALAVLGFTLAVSRVLLGMHFIRDVAAGAIIGILSGMLGIIIII